MAITVRPRLFTRSVPLDPALPVAERRKLPPFQSLVALPKPLARAAREFNTLAARRGPDGANVTRCHPGRRSRHRPDLPADPSNRRLAHPGDIDYDNRGTPGPRVLIEPRKSGGTAAAIQGSP